MNISGQFKTLLHPLAFVVAFLNTVKVNETFFKIRKKCLNLKVAFNGSLTFPDTLKEERLASAAEERGVCARACSYICMCVNASASFHSI